MISTYVIWVSFLSLRLDDLPIVQELGRSRKDFHLKTRSTRACVKEEPGTTMLPRYLSGCSLFKQTEERRHSAVHFSGELPVNGVISRTDEIAGIREFHIRFLSVFV
jgi:hypothetical protein